MGNHCTVCSLIVKVCVTSLKTSVQNIFHTDTYVVMHMYSSMYTHWSEVTNLNNN